MTIDRRNILLAARARRLLQIEARTILHGVVAVILALPIAIIWFEGPTQIVGYVYLALYVGFMAVPTALDLLLIFDAGRVLIGRSAAVVPWFLALVELGKNRQLPEPHDGMLRNLLILSVRGAPLTPLAGEAWIFAMRFRPDVWQIAKDQAAEIAQKIRETRRPPVPPRFIVTDMREWQQDVTRAQQLVGSC